jgi:hypothetical protein
MEVYRPKDVDRIDRVGATLRNGKYHFPNGIVTLVSKDTDPNPVVVGITFSP